MVHQGILNYLKEGKRRGFSFELLKQKLIEGGFQEEDVKEAIDFLEKEMPAVNPQISLLTKTWPAQNKIENEKIGTFAKIGKAITHPIELFEKTSNEKTWSALKYYLLILIIPFIAISILTALFLSFSASLFASMIPQINLGSLMTFSTTSLIFIVGFFAFVFFVMTPIAMFACAGILHLFVKLYGGGGNYKDTFRVSVYSSSPSTLLLAIPILNFGAMIWSFILGIIGISIAHKVSKFRAFLAMITFPLIVAIIYLVFIFIFAL